jgi:plasmid stabilization system protein ParE
MFDLFDHLCGVASEETAFRVVDRIYAAIDLLRENPRLGRPAEGKLRRELVVEDHIITYQVKSASVRVLRVEHVRSRR